MATQNTATAVHPNKAAFIEGVALTLDGWTALRLAVDNDWGNDGLGEEKREWIADILVDYFGQHGQQAEPEDIEDILLQIMQDEFNTHLEDGSPREVSRQLVNVFREVTRGNHQTVLQLRERQQQRQQRGNSAVQQSVHQPSGDGEDSDSDDEEAESNAV